MSDQEQPKMDLNNLYREETYTDQAVGTVRAMIPVTAAGDVDPARETGFFGAAQMMTPAGPMPLNFEIEADTLADACEKFPDSASAAMEDAFKEIQEMRRQQESQIVVPGQGGPGGGIQIP